MQLFNIAKRIKMMSIIYSIITKIIIQ